MLKERGVEGGIVRMIRQDDWMMSVLWTVNAVRLPDGWVGAGFVRNKVWDYLHGYPQRTPMNDVDVIYFNPARIDWEAEQAYEQQLTERLSGVRWSVKNQARMHVANGDAPYASSLDAVRFWPETATCVAVQIDATGQVVLGAPYSVRDLVMLRVRPTPTYRKKRAQYEARLAGKAWEQCWPHLDIYHMAD